eukprot:6229016-Pyramimonas_sp.AAC.1
MECIILAGQARCVRFCSASLPHHELNHELDPELLGERGAHARALGVHLSGPLAVVVRLHQLSLPEELLSSPNQQATET